MVTILAIACLALFAGVSFYVERSPVYPPFAMAACWAVFLGLHAVSRSVLFSIHEETLFFFVAGALAFCTGGLAVHYFYRPKHAPTQYNPARLRNVLTVFLLILCAAFPFYIRFITDLVADVATGNFWAILRRALIEESVESLSGFSLMDNMVVLADITVLIAWYHRDTEKWRAGVAFAFFLAYNTLTAGRSGFALVLVSLFTMEFMRQRRIPWRPLIALGLVFVVAIFGVAILVGKAGASANESLADNAPALVEGLQLYAIGGLVAFDNMYQHPSTIPGTQNIDRNFRIAANKLGLRSEIPYLHPEFSTVGVYGLDTNAYTIYFTYFPQLRALGSVVMMSLLGAAVTWAYLKVGGGGPQAVIMFSILFFGIPFSGFAEYYFNNLNFLAKLFLATALCYGWWFRRSQPQVSC
jgi:oligosaccharide repeat unit polymerase